MSDSFKGIFYSCTGDPLKPAVLFLHGFMGDKRDWDDIINRISDDFYCIAIDLPGHGQSNYTDLLKDLRDFNTLSLAINNLLSALHIKMINPVGYSMGGRIAQHFALKYPSRIDKMILESSSFGIKNKNEREIRLKADKTLSARLKTEDFEDFLDQWYNQSVFGRLKNHPRYQEMFKRRLSNDPLPLSQALEDFSVGRQSFLQHELSELKTSILLICGGKDVKYYQQLTDAAIKNRVYKCIVIDDCGHNTHFEKPNLFAEHLREFLSL